MTTPKQAGHTDHAEQAGQAGQADTGMLAAARRELGRWARGAEDVIVGAGGVDLATGEPFLAGTDVDIPGTLPLRLVRRFDAHPARPPGVFGPGWCSTLDVRLIVDSEGAGLVLPDGAVVLFPAVVDDGYTSGRSSVRQSLSGPYLVLTANGIGGHRVFDPLTEHTWHFPDSADGTVFPVAALTDQWGNRVLWRRGDLRLPEHQSRYSLVHSGGRQIVIDAPGAVGVGEETARLVVIDTAEPDSAPLHAVVSTAEPPGMPPSGGRVEHYLRPSDSGSLATTIVDGAPSRVIAFDSDLRARRWFSADTGEVTVDLNHRGQPIRITSAGVDRRLVRAPSGEVVSDAMAGTRWVIEYAAPGRPVVASGPEHQRLTAHWGESKLPVSLTVGHQPHMFETSPAGALTRVGFPGGGTAVVEVGASGMPIRVGDPDGYQVTITRDVLGRPRRVSEVDAGAWSLDAAHEVNRTPPDPSIGAAPEVDHSVTASFTDAGRARHLHVGAAIVFLSRHPDGSVAGASCGAGSAGVVGGVAMSEFEDNHDDDEATLSLPVLDPLPTAATMPAGGEFSGEFIADRVLCDPDSGVGVALLALEAVALLEPPGDPEPGAVVEVVFPDGMATTAVVPARRVTAVWSAEPSPFEALRTVPFLRGRLTSVSRIEEWVRAVDRLVTRPGDVVAECLAGHSRWQPR